MRRVPEPCRLECDAPARGEMKTPISPRVIYHLTLFSDWLCLNAAQPLALTIVRDDESQ